MLLRGKQKKGLSLEITKLKRNFGLQSNNSNTICTGWTKNIQLRSQDRGFRKTKVIEYRYLQLVIVKVVQTD